jgi:hypothetical protein
VAPDYRSIDFTAAATATEVEAAQQFFDRLPEAARARYQSLHINPSIRLGWVPITVRGDKVSEHHEALVSLICEPSPRLVLRTGRPISGELLFEAFSGSDEYVKVEPVGGVPSLPRSRHVDAHSYEARFPRTTFGNGVDLFRVGFSAFNLPPIMGNVVRLGGARRKSATAGRLVIASDDWIIALDPTENLRERVERAKVRGGHLLSHAGVLMRADNKPFDGDAVDVVLGALYWLLAFAMGQRCGPALPYGYRRDTHRVIWADWRMRAVDSYRAPLGWFDLNDREGLNRLFPRFFDLWQQPRMRRLLVGIISWYLAAQAPDPIEIAIPASQVALETLAHVVPLNRAMDDKALGGGQARNVARMLKSLSIPIGIPVKMTDLIAAAKPREPWKHGPDAITRLRDDLVHPKAKYEWNGEAMVDAWRLGLWYVEMALLAWLGYDGTYNSRLEDDRWRGKVVQVPWSPENG